MAETTSQLQQKLMALTNGKVNIMLNADEFKSTTQILREMAAVWQDMTDVQQAAALELLGGKRQANILSSLLQNFQTVEDVIQTSMSSSGSALRENEVWLDSIEGKTYQFTNALQTMWSNILDSEAIKGFIDFGTDAIQFLDTAHGKIIALVAAVKLMAKFKGFSLTGITKGLMQSMQQINVAQSALKALPQINNANGSFFASNINAYASAVSSLTPKLQAQALVTKGLNDEQIRSVMAINGVDQANIKLALSQVRVSNATKQQIAFSGQEAAAILASKNVTLSKIATDWLSKQAKDEVTEASVRQAMSTGILTKAEGAAIISTLGLSGANLGLAGSFKAVGTAIGFMFKSNPIGFILSLVTTVLSAISIFDSFGDSIEDVSQKVNELKTEYESLKETTKNNLTKLTESSDVKLYATLVEEFTELTKGVNNLGENVSLTSEQYERYRSICEDIVSISPALARGHNSATEAINNNADALANLIELEKEKQRQNALNYTTGENWDTLVEDSLTQYKDALDKRQSIMGSLGYAKAMTNRMGEQLRTYTKESQLFKALLEEYNISDTVSADAVANDSVKNFKELLSSLGYTQLGIDDIIETYTYTGNPGNGDNTMVGIGAWIEDNIEMLQDNVHLLKGTFAEAVSAYEAATYQLDVAQSSMIETLLEVPASMKTYENLSDSNKSFVNDWIQNSGMFEIDENTTADTMLKWKNTIKGFIGNLESDAYTYTLSDGAVVSAKDIIDSIYSLDPKGIDWSQYQAQMNTLIDYLWQAIGAENNTLGITDKNALALTFGFDLQLEDKNESQMIARYAHLKGITEEEAKAYFDSLPAIVVQRLLKVDWNLVDESNVDSTIANAMGSSSSNVITSKTYSVLSEKASEFDDVLSQTKEIVVDNTEVTQEYKDSLTDLGISEEDLADCFDENNPLIVKNAKALNNLVKASSKNVVNNVKLAKSQARLEYVKLIKQLTNTLNVTEDLNDETKESVRNTLDQANAVKLAMYQYQLLEDRLLGTTSAFDKFRQAQDIDAMNTYGDDITEMAQVIYDALYKTGEVGTEEFWAAVEAWVPRMVYAGKEGVAQLEAVANYLKTTIAPMLRLEDDEFSIDYDAAMEFVKKGIEVDAFEGTIDSFVVSDKFLSNLKEGETGVSKLADALGITKEAVYAFAAAYDKFNGNPNALSLAAQLDTSIEGRILNITSELEALNEQKLALLEDGGYEKNKAEIDKINTKIRQTGSELNKTGQEAYDMWQKYTENEAALASLEEISKTQENLTKEQAVTLGVEWDEENGLTVQQAIDQLLEKKLKLEEPTVLTAQFAVDYIYSEIDRIEALLQNPVQLEVEAEKAGQTVREFAAELRTELDGLKSDAATIATVFGIELDEDQQKTIKEELEDVEEITIHDKKFKVTATGLSTVVRQMKELVDLARELDGIDISGIDLNTSSSPTRDSNGIYLGDSYHPWGSGGRIPEFANGTFHIPNSAFANGSVGAPKAATALTGELGPEMIVRGNRWFTVGDNGAEFTQIKKGDIIFNHKQTKDLLSKGYVTSRGKMSGGAFASGANNGYISSGNIDSELKQYIHLLDQYDKDIRDAVAESNKYIQSLDNKYKKYGNIDNTDRNIVFWNDEAYDKYYPYIESMAQNAAMDVAEYYDKYLRDCWSTVLGTSGSFGFNDQNLDIAYSQMLNTGSDTKLLTIDEISNYIFDLMKKSLVDGKIDATKMIAFDAEGLEEEIQGETITVKNMLAGVEGQIVDGIALTKNDILAMSGDLSEGLDSIYKDFSMHEIQANSLFGKYTEEFGGNSEAFFRLEELSYKYGMTLDDLTEKLYNLKSQINSDPLGINNEDTNIKTFRSSLTELGITFDESIGKWFDGKKEFDINVTDLVSTLQAQGWSPEAIKAYCTELSQANIDGVIINVNSQAIDDALAKINSIPTAITTTYEVDYQTVGNWNDEAVHIPGSGGRYTKYANGTVHVNGNAYSNGNFGAPKTETALVGELGPELLVRNGRWTTIGEDGAEFSQVKKGDIIFNHKQTEDLLSKGFVTGRGKAYASGTAYATPNYSWQPISPDKSLSNDPGKDLSDAAGDISDAAEEFKEVFDWIEVRLEEINEDLSLKGAKLENAVGSSTQNAIIDDMIDLNKSLYSTLITGSKEYYSYAKKLLAKIPAEYRDAAQDGTIAIETFTKDAGEETLNAIQEYREWVQKGADATQQAEETLSEISSLAKQAFDNIAADYENKTSLRDNKIDQLDAYNALAETKYGSESADIYKAIIKENNKNIKILENQRDAMQAELNAQVQAGNIKKYSQDWYDAVNDIAAVDTEIIELTADTYDFQDAINELHWDHLDNLLSRFEAISNEAENLIDILGNKDMVDEAGNWTDEGITSLGLYAQQMEIAEVEAKKYQDEIAYLNKNWKALGYTEQEYLEKLDELKSGQYDAIKMYHESKDAIVDLNKTRIDAIKNGIQKEIDAFEELIKKKKELLDADKDLYDFEKSINEQQKNIAKIERKLAALATDNSSSAAAQRKKLEEELIEAKGELEDTFYERSIQNQQNALDKELENFQNAKNDEMEGWDEYLENTEQVVSDSLTTIQANTEVVYETLKSMGREYGLTIAETLTSPWKDGESAIQSYAEKFGLSMSSTVEELQKLAVEYKKIMDEIEGYGDKVVNQVNKNAESYVAASNPSGKVNRPSSPSKNKTPSGNPTTKQEESKSITVGGKINAGSARIYANSDGGGGSKQYFSSDPIYVVLGEQNGYLKVRHHSVSSGVTGWFRKSDVKAYAKGTKGIDRDQLALIDELGEELQLVPDGNGRLAYLKKGTAILNNTMTERLMDLAMNPQDVLDRSRPVINAPHIVNNEIAIDASIAELIHIDNVSNDTLPNLEKVVEKQMDKYVKNLNGQIRKYAR